jgi:hypothetical protein
MKENIGCNPTIASNNAANGMAHFFNKNYFSEKTLQPPNKRRCCCKFKSLRIVSWDRCYDFLNIFAEFFGEKIGFFDSKQS